MRALVLALALVSACAGPQGPRVRLAPSDEAADLDTCEAEAEAHWPAAATYDACMHRLGYTHVATYEPR